MSKDRDNLVPLDEAEEDDEGEEEEEDEEHEGRRRASTVAPPIQVRPPTGKRPVRLRLRPTTATTNSQNTNNNVKPEQNGYSQSASDLNHSRERPYASQRVERNQRRFSGGRRRDTGKAETSEGARPQHQQHQHQKQHHQQHAASSSKPRILRTSKSCTKECDILGSDHDSARKDHRGDAIDNSLYRAVFNAEFMLEIVSDGGSFSDGLEDNPLSDFENLDELRDSQDGFVLNSPCNSDHDRVVSTGGLVDSHGSSEYDEGRRRYSSARYPPLTSTPKSREHVPSLLGSTINLAEDLSQFDTDSLDDPRLNQTDSISIHLNSSHVSSSDSNKAFGVEFEADNVSAYSLVQEGSAANSAFPIESMGSEGIAKDGIESAGPLEQSQAMRRNILSSVDSPQKSTSMIMENYLRRATSMTSEMDVNFSGQSFHYATSGESTVDEDGRDEPVITLQISRERETPYERRDHNDVYYGNTRVDGIVEDSKNRHVQRQVVTSPGSPNEALTFNDGAVVEVCAKDSSSAHRIEDEQSSSPAEFRAKKDDGCEGKDKNTRQQSIDVRIPLATGKPEENDCESPTTQSYRGDGGGARAHPVDNDTAKTHRRQMEISDMENPRKTRGLKEKYHINDERDDEHNLIISKETQKRCLESFLLDSVPIDKGTTGDIPIRDGDEDGEVRVNHAMPDPCASLGGVSTVASTANAEVGIGVVNPGKPDLACDDERKIMDTTDAAFSVAGFPEGQALSKVGTEATKGDSEASTSTVHRTADFLSFLLSLKDDESKTVVRNKRQKRGSQKQAQVSKPATEPDIQEQKESDVEEPRFPRGIDSPRSTNSTPFICAKGQQSRSSVKMVSFSKKHRLSKPKPHRRPVYKHRKHWKVWPSDKFLMAGQIPVIKSVSDNSLLDFVQPRTSVTKAYRRIVYDLEPDETDPSQSVSQSDLEKYHSTRVHFEESTEDTSEQDTITDKTFETMLEYLEPKLGSKQPHDSGEGLEMEPEDMDVVNKLLQPFITVSIGQPRTNASVRIQKVSRHAPSILENKRLSALQLTTEDPMMVRELEMWDYNKTKHYGQLLSSKEAPVQPPLHHKNSVSVGKGCEVNKSKEAKAKFLMEDNQDLKPIDFESEISELQLTYLDLLVTQGDNQPTSTSKSRAATKGRVAQSCPKKSRSLGDAMTTCSQMECQFDGEPSSPRNCKSVGSKSCARYKGKSKRPPTEAMEYVKKKVDFSVDMAGSKSPKLLGATAENEDNWHSTVNAMLLRAEKAKRDIQTPEEDHRFPRSNSARVVHPVRERGAVFLSQLLEQDQQEQRLRSIERRSRLLTPPRRKEEFSRSRPGGKLKKTDEGKPYLYYKYSDDIPDQMPLQKLPPINDSQNMVSSLNSAGILKIKTSASQAAQRRAFALHQRMMSAVNKTSSTHASNPSKPSMEAASNRYNRTVDFSNPLSRTVPRRNFDGRPNYRWQSAHKATVGSSLPQIVTNKSKIDADVTPGNFLLDSYSDVFQYYNSAALKMRQAACADMFLNRNTNASSEIDENQEEKSDSSSRSKYTKSSIVNMKLDLPSKQAEVNTLNPIDEYWRAVHQLENAKCDHFITDTIEAEGLDQGMIAKKCTKASNQEHNSNAKRKVPLVQFNYGSISDPDALTISSCGSNYSGGSHSADSCCESFPIYAGLPANQRRAKRKEGRGINNTRSVLNSSQSKNSSLGIDARKERKTYTNEIDEDEILYEKTLEQRACVLGPHKEGGEESPMVRRFNPGSFWADNASYHIKGTAVNIHQRKPETRKTVSVDGYQQGRRKVQNTTSRVRSLSHIKETRSPSKQTMAEQRKALQGQIFFKGDVSPPLTSFSRTTQESSPKQASQQFEYTMEEGMTDYCESPEPMHYTSECSMNDGRLETTCPSEDRSGEVTNGSRDRPRWVEVFQQYSDTTMQCLELSNFSEDIRRDSPCMCKSTQMDTSQSNRRSILGEDQQGNAVNRNANPGLTPSLERYPERTTTLVRPARQASNHGSITSASRSSSSAELKSPKKRCFSGTKDFLRMLRGPDLVSYMVSNEHRMLQSLKAVTRSSRYLPVFFIQSVNPDVVEAQVIHLHFCFDYEKHDEPQRLLLNDQGITTSMVFYSQEMGDDLTSMYTLHDVPAGLYSLDNSDSIPFSGNAKASQDKFKIAQLVHYPIRTLEDAEDKAPGHYIMGRWTSHRRSAFDYLEGMLESLGNDIRGYFLHVLDCQRPSSENDTPASSSDPSCSEELSEIENPEITVTIKSKPKSSQTCTHRSVTYREGNIISDSRFVSCNCGSDVFNDQGVFKTDSTFDSWKITDAVSENDLPAARTWSSNENENENESKQMKGQSEVSDTTMPYPSHNHTHSDSIHYSPSGWNKDNIFLKTICPPPFDMKKKLPRRAKKWRYKLKRPPKKPAWMSSSAESEESSSSSESSESSYEYKESNTSVTSSEASSGDSLGSGPFMTKHRLKSRYVEKKPKPVPLKKLQETPEAVATRLARLKVMERRRKQRDDFEEKEQIEYIRSIRASGNESGDTHPPFQLRSNVPKPNNAPCGADSDFDLCPDEAEMRVMWDEIFPKTKFLGDSKIKRQKHRRM